MVHYDEWCTLRSDEEEHWDVTGPLHHDSSIHYSVLNLYNKLPSFTAVDDENDLFSPYSKEPKDLTFQNVHIPSEYSTAEDDYFYEAASMLRLINQPQGWESKVNTLALTEDGAGGRHKYLVLYNFIALSLVRKAKDDVCAVALYQSPTSVEVYYAKNRPRGENADSEISYDKSHAEALAALIRTTAKVRSTARQFGLQYFQLLHNNCFEKLSRRLSSLQSSCRARTSGSNASSVIEEIRVIIANTIFKKRQYTEADIQAIELAEIEELPSAVDFVLLELMKILQEIPEISEKINAPTASSIAKLTPVLLRDISLLSWIIDQSSIFRVILHRTRSMAIAKLVSNLRKFGQYYRGCEQLHNAILKSNLNKPYQALRVRHVPSPDPESHKMYNDWYQALDLIYYRTRQRDMLISHSQFVTSYPSIKEYHNEWSTQMFIRHAEVCLIDNLMKLGKRPTEIGVSKLCCRACYVWINAVNKTMMEKGRRENWAVSGTHGKYYPWQRDANSHRFEAEREVLQDLYDQLAGKVDLVLSPTGDSDEGSEEGASARVRSSAAKDYRKRRLSAKATATFSGS